MKFMPALKIGSPKEKIILGLDIGTSAIKFAKLRFTKGGVELCRIGIEPLQAGLEPILKNIIKDQNIKKANISVCGPSTIIRYVNFPKMTAQELAQSLKFEAQKHIPFSVSEVNLDAAILKSDLADNKMLVMLAAIKKDFLAARLKLIESAGFSVSNVDIDSVALINAFNFNYTKEDLPQAKSIALLNIGSSFSNLSILEEGMPHLSRDIQVAGNNFTQKLEDGLEIDFKSAEALKFTSPDKEKAQKITQGLESMLSSLAAEVRTSFDYYESQGTLSVAKIFLSGAGSIFPGFKDLLANILGIEVEYWDPLRKIKVSEEVDAQKIKMQLPRLAVAIGIALHS
ncbi:MAG: type IV pilus assembly protein PilM [Candidatus Omnitrophica bacterium]|nr:type IV pilus assembly protein PilM [Candidatus Omnitrophota bacterium]